MLYQAVKHSSLPKAQTKTEERFVKVILLDSLTWVIKNWKLE